MKTKITFILFLFTLICFAQTDPCGTILNDTFDIEGTIPSEWTEYNTSGNVTVVNGKLKFEHTTEKPSAYRTLTPISNTTMFTFEVSASRNSVNCQIHLISSTGKYLTSISIGKQTASIKIATSMEGGLPNGFTDGTPKITLIKNTDYKISAQINFNTKKVNFYNDGVLVYADIPFLETAEDIAKIDIQSLYMYSNNGQFIFDAISFLSAEENRLNLMSSIGSTETLMTSVYVGDTYGAYPQSAVDAFQIAINTANEAVSNCNTLSSVIDQALIDLQTALVLFGETKVNDPVLKIYSEYGFSGDVHEIYCGYYNGGLAEYDNWAVSFKLEKGYMATFAQDINGLGTSKVYIAQENDLAINLPEELQNLISFIRVSPWFNATKKGASGKGIDVTNVLNVSWYYNWGTEGVTTQDREFVPMTWSGVPSLSKVEALGKNMGYSNYLAFNEPDGPDQANMTVEKALEAYKNMLASGLRLGAPAVTHENRGIIWLDEFMAGCKERNYRVDFIPIHHYVRRSTAGLHTWLKEKIYDKHQLPLWLTEYNYGNANYSTVITDEVALAKLKEINTMLDTTDFIERYSLFFFQPSQGQLSIFKTRTPIVLNDSGEYYRDHNTDTAYIQETYEQGVNLAVTSFKKPTIGLYPNPVTHSLLSIQYTDASLFTNAVIKIYNVYGKQVLMKTDAPREIDLSHLNNGVYLVQVLTKEVKVTKKIMITNQK